jgi:hypothetical protein
MCKEMTVVQIILSITTTLPITRKRDDMLKLLNKQSDNSA